MLKPSSPCRDCSSKFAGCHDRCGAFSEFKMLLATYNKIVRDSKQAQYDLDEVEIRRFEKYNRQKQYRSKQGAYD